MTMGVYAIRNTNTGARYIGSSTNIERRAQQHVQELNRLATRQLPADLAWPFVCDWIQYGQDAFEVDVLEVHHITVEWYQSPHKDIWKMLDRERWFIANTPCEYNRKKPSHPALRINHDAHDQSA